MKTRSSQSPSRQSAARTNSAQGIRRWMAAGILTALVLAVVAGAMLQAPQPAAAQTPLKILVNNSGHPAENLGSSSLDADIPRQAQQFTTGSDAAGYTLEKIFIGFKFIADPSTAGSELTLTLSEESSGSPGTALCTLRDPSIFNRSGGLHSYSTPNMGMDQCPALRASTTYFAVIERANLDTSTIELLTTSIYGGDSHNAEGWSIGNGAHRYVSANTPPWTHSSGSANILIRVQGVAIPHPPRVTGFDLHRDNNNPTGIWGNGKTIWVSQSGTAPKFFAYNRSDGSRDSSKDFNTLNAADNDSPTGLCSDGTTMFVVDRDDNKVYAYTLSTKARDSTKDITLAMANANATGVWCDANTIWVANAASAAGNKIFAYKRLDGTHDSTKDMESLYVSSAADGENAEDPSGLWSNGTTMFVTDSKDDKVYAYKLSDESRDSDKEIALDSDNADPEGLWFDGRVLWVVDDAEGRVYVYDLPGAQPDNTRASGVPVVRTPTSEDVWTATLTAGTHGLFGDGYIAASDPDTGSLSPGAMFTLDGVTYTVTNLSTGAGGLSLGLDKEPPREFTLSVGGESFVSAGRSGVVVGAAYGYIWHDVGFAWSASDTISVVLSVDYVPKKGGELTADVSGIMDSTDGVANAFFHYQWFRVDGTDETELDGETGLTYTPTDDDVDKHLKVLVIFDDDAGNQEYPRTSRQVGPVGMNSPATGAPAITGTPRAGETLTVDLSGITDPEGTDAAEFTYQWIRIDGDSESDIPNATRAAYRPTDEYTGQKIKVRVSFTDNEGFPEGPLASEPTDPIVAADVLVKNTGQGPADPTYSLSTTTSKRAQAFTTGPDTVGYELHSAGFRFANIAITSTAGSELTATLHQTNGNDPGTELCTLDDPASFSASGVNTFTAPTSGNNLCPKLTHSTTYFVVLTRANNNTSTITLSVTNSNAEDAGSSDGWTISNNRSQYSGTSWAQSVSQSHMIEVKGDTAAAPIVSGHRTWVDNRQGVASTNYESTGSFTIAQGFRTGDTVGIFEVHEIHVDFDRGQPETGTIRVSIVESTSPDDDWEHATPFHFERGGEYAQKPVLNDGVHTFRRTSGNSALRANTNYFLVIESTSNDPAEAAIVRMTIHEGETSDDDWTVDNYSHTKSKQDGTTWTKQDHQVRFRISGSFRNGIGMAGDSYGFESCVELRRGERTNCIVAIAVPEPADPDSPPPNVSKSNLDLSHEAFADWTEFTGWWQWMHQTVDVPVMMHPLPSGSDSVTMSYGSREYTAKSGHDYWNTQGSVRFDATSNHTQTVRVQIIDDGLEDSGETFSFYLYRCQDQDGDSCDHLFVDSSVDGIIYNTEESAEIAYLEVSDVTVTEADGATAEFTVSLTAPTTAAVYFEYATEDGTAKDGTDYTGGSGTAFLANGDTSVTISVPISNDEVWTGNRSFTLNISEAVYAGISDDSGKATIRDDEPEPLIGHFTNMPSGNHGEKPFTFNISFNQDISTKYLVMQNDALTVTNGEVTRAERINGNRDFWRITVEPDSGADVTVHLPATVNCSDTGAICTYGTTPTPQSNSITHTFPGTQLNARLANLDEYHDGSTAFKFTLVFSEEVETTVQEIRDHALTITGGTFTNVVQEDENTTRRWEVTVKPAGTGNIEVLIAGATDCDTNGHVCTGEGELLAAGDRDTSYGPPRISVADATVQEAEGAQLAFIVTLDRIWFGPEVTFKYAASDGTATAEDYTATSGTETLRWNRPLTINVPVTNDSLTEDTETLTLTLSQPRWAALGDAVATGTIQDGEAPSETEETTANSESTGLPTISGTPQVDHTLTAGTSAIADADGPADITFTYQWLAGGTNIAEATNETLFLTSSEQGQTVQVRVSFTDDADNQETLTSAATLPVAQRASTTVWQADMLVVQYTENTIGAASADLFSNVGGSADLQIRSLWSSVPDRDLRLAFTSGVDAADNMTLEVGDLSLPFPTGSSGNGSFKWTNVDVDWQDGETIAVRIVPTTAPVIVTTNSPPTGLPTITGTPKAGQELTADTSAIQDADGLTNVSYRYQWIANDGVADADVQDATASTYTASVNDVGKTIKVRVSFTDDAENDESLTSVATLAVAAIVPTAPLGLALAPGTQPETLDASWTAPSSNGGSEITGYTVEWKQTTASWDTPADVSQATVTGTGHTITGLTGDVQYTLRVLATNGAGDGPVSAEAAATPAAVPEQPPEPENNAPTGLPTISGTPQVGKTLTTSTSGIADRDGLGNVSYNYQWLADGSNIAGATGTTLLLTSSHQGKTIAVGVSFSDDAGNSESLTSAPTLAVAAKPADPLTATFSNVPATHNGGIFTFHLDFSVNVRSGYKNLRDYAFSVIGGEVDKAQRRTQGSNQYWLITVDPDGNGDVTVTLPATTDCNATGAICDYDSNMLSNSPSFTVQGT